jgi:hypothetical protein
MPNNHHPFDGMDIRITRASNGMIVSIKDDNRSQGELHVIHDNEDMGQELGKIITMSVLKKE